MTVLALEPWTVVWEFGAGKSMAEVTNYRPDVGDRVRIAEWGFYEVRRVEQRLDENFMQYFVAKLALECNYVKGISYEHEIMASRVTRVNA